MSMKKFRILSVGILLALAITLPAGAASPQLGVQIEAEMTFGAPTSGTFSASGPAEDVLICEAGNVRGTIFKGDAVLTAHRLA